MPRPNEMRADPAAMFENLWPEGILYLGDIVQVLQQRQIAVSLHITLDARIAVPVPGAAEVAAHLDNTNISDALLLQARGCQQSGKPAAQHHNIHIF